MNIQNLIDVSTNIYGSKDFHVNLKSFLAEQTLYNKPVNTFYFLNYLSEHDMNADTKQKCNDLLSKIESTRRHEDGLTKLFTTLDQLFSMNSIMYIINNFGDTNDLGIIKLHKIAFTTNYFEIINHRCELGFGETFTAYKYGPWSLELQLNV